MWVGPTRDPAVRMWIDRYVRRMQRWVQVIVEEVRAGPYPPERPPDVALEKDAQRLLRVLEAYPRWVLLHPEGRPWTAREWYHWWLEQVEQDQPVALVAGGPHGVAPRVRAAATWVVSLGPITLSHQLIRAVLMEHTYRVLSLWQGTPFAK